MEDFLFPYNQPVVKAKYDLIIDGKIVADEVVTKNGSVGGEGMTEEERQILVGAAQKNSDNTFSANNTFTGTLDISNAQIVTPDGWNVDELTPEAIQQVVPIAWSEWTTPPSFVDSQNKRSVLIGDNVKGYNDCVIIGWNSSSSQNHAVGIGVGTTALGFSEAIGYVSQSGVFGVSLGAYTYSKDASVAVGYIAKSSKKTSVTIGSNFTETTDSGNVTHTCTTEGTGSITIGAGANTLNNGDAESSNSVTIGCKALNQGADSVVIGASAKNPQKSSVVIGAGAKTTYPYATIIGTKASGMGTSMGYNAQTASGGVAIGQGSFSNTGTSVGNHSYNYGHAANAFGDMARASAQHSTALGYNTKSSGFGSTAIGSGAKSNDEGTVVFRSTAEGGAYTQLYFIGANTPLANTYANGEAIMGYVTSDKDGNPLASGFKRLSALFDEGTMTQPATLDEFGEWVQPKVFHPSDLDMPIEEDTFEPEEYQPLPVYPIIEPTIEEIID